MLLGFSKANLLMELLIDEEREDLLVEVPETLSTIGDENVFCAQILPERLNLYPHVRLYNHRTEFYKLCKVTWRPIFSS